MQTLAFIIGFLLLLVALCGLASSRSTMERVIFFLLLIVDIIIMVQAVQDTPRRVKVVYVEPERIESRY